MPSPSRTDSTADQSVMSTQKGRTHISKAMASGRRLLPVVAALALLVGILGAAPAAHADNCTYSSDGYVALCPGGSNYSYLYQYYNRQWNQVATVVFSGNWVLLSNGGATIAQNSVNGQTWVYTTTGWINITGMSTAQVYNALTVNSTMSNDLVRHVQVMAGLTSMPDMPYLWP